MLALQPWHVSRNFEGYISPERHREVAGYNMYLRCLFILHNALRGLESLMCWRRSQLSVQV